jgi:hypothetical protein
MGHEMNIFLKGFVYNIKKVLLLYALMVSIISCHLVVEKIKVKVLACSYPIWS